MPIYPDNFQANSLSGSVLITDGHANISLTTNPYALEGDKSFVVKLRKGGPSGLVIATSSPITLRDTSSIVSLTANISSVNEGNLVQFTLVTANAVDNSNVYYSVFPATANITTQDFFGANIGKATIISNQATFALRANADLSLVDETGENFRVQLRTNSPVGNIIYATSNVTILDVSKGFNILSFVESAATVGEGTPITLTFNATNIPVGTVFHYFTEGNATVSTFAGGNTGSFVMNSFSNTITLNPTGVPYSTTQNFNVKLRALSNTGAVVATSNNLIVIDSAIAYMTATGGNVAIISGYKVHTFNTSGVLNVTGLGATGQLEILSVAGGGSGGGDTGSSSGGSGGGAGGYVYTPSVSAILGNITVTIGGGGANPGASNAANGGNTSITGANFANILSVGGGKGGFDQNPGPANFPGGNGGSGGGAGYFSGSVGSGYNYPGPTQQGYPGGSSVITPSPFTWTTNTGGGGAGAAGSSGNFSGGSLPAGNGGIGIQSNISGFSAYYAGGGGGGYGQAGDFPRRGLGGNGGGGAGGSAGIVNTGGGGGGGGPAVAGYSGGSGVVIIRYPYVAPITISNVVTSSNVFTVGSNITFTVNAQNANLITLYYSTDGNVIASNFIGGNTGSFVANASGGIVTLQANTNIPLNESRQFILQIRQDSTTGFISGSSANIEIAGYATYVYATGGDLITVAGGYRTHVFTSSNTFNVSKITAGASNVEYLLVAGGGGGAVGLAPFVTPGSAGGAGGLLTGNVTVTGQTYTVTVGGGGTSAPARGVNGSMGSNTIVFGITTFGGGGGSYALGSNQYGLSGGSGGGAGGYVSTNGDNKYGGNAIVGQGYPGGSMTGSNPGGSSSTGGGGAGGAGADFVGIDNGPRIGGIGLAIPWAPSSYGTPGPAPGRWFAGGGGGSTDVNTGQPGAGGAGGGGRGAMASPSQDLQAFGGNAFTGGGGGGGYSPTYLAGSGGSGIVIIRYPYS